MTKSTDSADYQHTRRPIAGMPKDFKDGSIVAPHRHRRSQLIWATEGVMAVTAAAATWMVPPQRALWIPAGTVHAIRMSGAVAMRTLYIEPDAAPALSKDCKVVLMTGLLRELVLEAVRSPLDEDQNGRMSHVEALILDEITMRDAEPLHLPMPRDRRLRLICETLLRAPGRQETLEHGRTKPAPAAGRWRACSPPRPACVLSIGAVRHASPQHLSALPRAKTWVRSRVRSGMRAPAPSRRCSGRA